MRMNWRKNIIAELKEPDSRKNRKHHNGDAFCIDKRNETIVFLEHDVVDGGPNVHGLLLAINFDDLIKKWSKVCFVEVFDWTDGINEDGIDVESIIFSRLFLLINNS